MLSFLHTFFTMKTWLPEYRVTKLLLDAAHDADAVYRYCQESGIQPFIDLNSGNTGNTGNTGNSGNTGNTGGGTNNNSGSSGSDSGTTTTPSGRLWHATVAQAQAYAAGAAAQRGWTGNDWDCLVRLWTRESSWLWYAENASSGAYGIPQSLPADKMAAFGANYRDDAAVQIDWGLWYIAQAYGSPSKAWQHSEQVGWY